MPPNRHAVLSASSSHRWLHCNPSARLELEFEDRETSAASEGTAAHALCEHKLKRRLKLRSDRPVSVWDNDEMEQYTDEYVDFVMEQVIRERRRDENTQVLIEQRLDFSCFVPDGFGTGDCLIVSKGRLHIIDFKYGQGVLVEAEDNPQMKLYALGALEQFGEQESEDDHLPAPPRERQYLGNDRFQTQDLGKERPQTQSGTRIQGRRRVLPRRVVLILQGGGQVPCKGRG